MQEITVPGTNTKIPVVGALAAALVIAVIVILRKSGGEETEQAGNVSGLLAAEVDQRLREMWEATVNLIAEAMEEVGQSDPVTPPGTPVDPRPKAPPADPKVDCLPGEILVESVCIPAPSGGESYKDYSDSPLKIVFNEIIEGGPVKVGQSNPISPKAPPVSPKAPPVSPPKPPVISDPLSCGPGEMLVEGICIPSGKGKGGAYLYTLGSYDLL